MPNIRVQCPSCRETLEIDAQHAGEEVECGSCFQVFVAKASPPLRNDDDDDDDADDFPRRRRATRDDYDDPDDNYPRRRRVRRRPIRSAGSDAATWSLVLGLLSLPAACCCVLVSVPLSIGAIGLGIVGMKSETGKSLAIAGIVCGGLSLLLTVGTFFAGFGMNAFNRGGPFGGIGR